MNFSEEQILSMAPDDSSKKSGKDLANAAKWVKKHLSDRSIWGECQGSGKLPYQTQVDLANIAFKCSCPSRKFPCKHGLGLLLLYARDKKLFSTSTEPDWVTDWLDKRTERDEKKIEKKTKEKNADPEAQAKRQENRLRRVEDGMSELRLWIKDIIRNGMINIPGKDPSYFEGMARRMVDAQAPGLASMVRILGNINFYQDGWQTPFLDQVLRIYLVLNGFSRLDQLPDDLQDELKTQVGFTQNQESLKNEKGIRDNWFVLAKQSEKEENLTTERNWLYGINSKKYVLVLQFYFKGQLPELNLPVGSCIDAEVVSFKGTSSLRALVKEQYGIMPSVEIAGFKDWNEALSSSIETYSVNPFINRLPVIIENVTPVPGTNEWYLKDQNGDGVKGEQQPDCFWKLMSISGGKPVRLFAVGRENNFEPIGVWMNNQYLIL
jgi:hypothetical protein